MPKTKTWSENKRNCRIVKWEYGSKFLNRDKLVTAFSRTSRINTQKMKFSIKGFFSKCDQIRSFLRIWSHLLKKFLMENFIFCAVNMYDY